MLVRMYFIREKKLEILGGGGEHVFYSSPDGQHVSNWELIHTPEYSAFKEGFHAGFEGRPPRPEDVGLGMQADYETGFRCGSLERKK